MQSDQRGRETATDHLTILEGMQCVPPGHFKQQNLESIAFGKTVKEIGMYAFEKCEKLTDVAFSKGLETIGIRAFKGCCALTAITIPKSVTCIGEGAFYGCSALTEVVLIGVNIDEFTFYNCSKLVSITLPEGTAEIGKSAFSGCTALSEVVMPSSLVKIGEYAFKNCKNLPFIKIPAGVGCILNAAFVGCLKLSAIEISTTVTSIHEDAFMNCPNLNKIIISRRTAIKDVQRSQFGNGLNIKQLSIPNSEGCTVSGFKGCELIIRVVKCICPLAPKKFKALTKEYNYILNLLCVFHKKNRTNEKIGQAVLPDEMVYKILSYCQHQYNALQIISSETEIVPYFALGAKIPTNPYICSDFPNEDDYQRGSVAGCVHNL